MNTQNKRKVHLVGIGGIGTSALAQYFLSSGWEVSGSDLSESEITKGLEKKGIRVVIGHNKENVKSNTSLLVKSQAIPSSNSELKKAKSLGISILSYSEVLGELTREYKSITVAGSHGKSTTTSLLSRIAIDSGLEPTVFLGTKLKDLSEKDSDYNNFRYGKSDLLILEADEWKGSFLDYSPTLSIITNIDKEHLDFYKNLENIKKSFLLFIKNTKEGGSLILNADDNNLFNLKDDIQEIANNRSLDINWFSRSNCSDVLDNLKQVLKMPGNHNIENALAAYTALVEGLGVTKDDVIRGMSGFDGAWRRSEYKGEVFGAQIFDDYAHHPKEIKSTLQGFRKDYSDKNLVCVFQPHQGKRLKALFDEFSKAFNFADDLFLLPVYEVAGRDEFESEYTSQKLLRSLNKDHFSTLEYVEEVDDLQSKLGNLIEEKPSSLILMMGAGDIYKYTKKLIKQGN